MITLDYNEKTKKGKIIGDETIIKMIRNHFSVKKSGSHFIKKINRNIPTRDYAIQIDGTFGFGLYHEIRKYIIDNQITEIEYTDSFIQRLKIGFGSIIVSDELTYSLRYYQAEALETAFKRGFGTIVAATGAGKSLIQANLIETYKKIHGDDFKCLLIVPGLALVEQLKKDFTDYGCTFTFSGWVGGNSPEDTQVIIVNTENLSSQFGNFKFLVDVDLVLTDECHKISAKNKLTRVVQKIKTPHKFGFTGTLPKSLIDVWKIYSVFGPVIYEKNSKELRDEDFLSDVVIKCIKLNHKFKKMKYVDELNYLHTLDSRNHIICRIANRVNGNILILVNRIEHGQSIKDTYTYDDKQVYFVSGEMPVSERNEIVSKMETESNICCVAMSSIFSTGINVKNLPYVMFVDGGKSFIRIVQSIGRGLRLHENKNKLVLFDIYDNLKYSFNHSEERKNFYIEQSINFDEVEINL